MQTVEQIYQAQIDIKKSTFLSFLCPFKDFKILIERLKKEHPKAVHFVYAYRYLNEFNQIIEDKSDDGEPKGTSGIPSLNVLRGYNLINTAVIVVRYFGGIKLGTGGLVRAYSDAVNVNIQKAKLLKFELKNTLKININIQNLGRLEYYLNKNNINFTRIFQEDKVIVILNLTQEEEKQFQIFTKTFTPQELKFI